MKGECRPPCQPRGQGPHGVEKPTEKGLLRQQGAVFRLRQLSTREQEGKPSWGVGHSAEMPRHGRKRHLRLQGTVNWAKAAARRARRVSRTRVSLVRSPAAERPLTTARSDPCASLGVTRRKETGNRSAAMILVLSSSSLTRTSEKIRRGQKQVRV